MIILIFIFFLGCGRMGEKQKFFADKDPTQIFSQSATQEVFTQEESSIQESFTQETTVDIKKSFVDILFVIDNSGSMGDEQAALADNFDSFIDKFLTLNIDFKIGIITSDSSYNRDSQKKLNSTEAKADDTEFKNLFKKKIQVGIGGSGHEMPADYTKKFFKNYPKWSAKDAYLAIIIISDENDFSPKDVNLVEYLKTLKEDDDLVKIFAIVTLEKIFTRVASYGESHINAAKATGGSYHSIRDPFDSILDSFGKTITELATRFKIEKKLTADELENIRIRVDGTEVAREAWTFHTKNNSISFNEGHIPAQESKVEILFVELVSQFALQKKLDVSLLDTIDIEIDGKVIPREGWQYNEESNSIKFLKGHVPQIGSSIKIVYNVTSQFPLKKKLDVSTLDTIDISVNGKSVSRDHWQYDEKNNAIQFHKDHLPSVGSKIKIIYTDAF